MDFYSKHRSPTPPAKTNTAVWMKVRAVKMLTWGKRQQHNSTEEPEQRRRAAFCVGLKTTLAPSLKRISHPAEWQTVVWMNWLTYCKTERLDRLDERRLPVSIGVVWFQVSQCVNTGLVNNVKQRIAWRKVYCTCTKGVGTGADRGEGAHPKSHKSLHVPPVSDSPPDQRRQGRHGLRKSTWRTFIPPFISLLTTEQDEG